MRFHLDIQFFASKKGVGSTKNGRDSHAKRLGAKLADGQYCHAGSVIYRQRGTKIHPGTNVGRGGDDTLFAKPMVSFVTNAWAKTAKSFCISSCLRSESENEMLRHLFFCGLVS